MTFEELSYRDKFIVSRWAYSIGKPVIQDTEYNMLLAYMKAQYPDDDYLKRSWSSDPCPVDLLRKIKRNDLIVNVSFADKTESIPSLDTEAAVHAELFGVSAIGTLSYKHDGFNVQASYFRGYLLSVNTRGRSSDAMDISRIKSILPQTIPVQDPVKIVGELTISKNNFILVRKKYYTVSPRSSVSTILAHPEDIDKLSFSAFDIHGYDYGEKHQKFDVLRSWGFQTPEYRKVLTFASILHAVNELSAADEYYPEPTDGVVYDGIKRVALRIKRWTAPIYNSYVVDYVETYNKHRISPALVIRDIVRTDGATQHQVNITNWQRILDMDLAPGTPIAFQIKSSATADIDEGATAVLRQTWQGHEDEYRASVDENERVKFMLKCMEEG